MVLILKYLMLLFAFTHLADVCGLSGGKSLIWISSLAKCLLVFYKTGFFSGLYVGNLVLVLLQYSDGRLARL